MPKTKPTNTTSSILIDAAEVARLLSVSKPTIWRLRDDGKLPPTISLTSQCIRWNRDAVLSWINAGCPVPSESTAGHQPEVTKA